MKKTVLLFYFSLFIFHFSLSQNPLVKQWDKRFGGNDWDWLTAFQETRDGGYILGGYSWSGISGDKTQASKGGADYWIVKIDSIGNKQWDKDFGGTDEDKLYSLQQTTDGGYILGGASYSGSGGDKTQPNKGIWDYWIIKIDSLGNKLWDKDFGGTGGDVLYSLQQTTDGGYLLGGRSYSGIGGDKTQATQGSIDYWIVKIDSLGIKQWDKDLGGTNDDWLHSLLQTTDGGYILGGYSDSGIGGDKTEDSKGFNDYWVIKIDAFGNKQWDRDFGGADDEYFSSLQQSADGGYVLGGVSYSVANGDKTQPLKGGTDLWIIKIDSLGNKQWDKDFGGSLNEDEFANIAQTTDGGYLIGGVSYSPKGGDKTENNLGIEQTWIVKTDSLGNKQWDKTLFTTGHDETGLAVQTRNGCYTFANYTAGGVAGYKTQASQGYEDYWIIKFCDSTMGALPVANFISSDTTFCDEAGKCIDFTDKSTNNPTSWQWSFPGAIPSSSTQQNPTNICYTTPGTYPVTLIVSNSAGSDTITVAPMVTLCNIPPIPVITWQLNTLCAGTECGYQWYKDGTPIPGETNQCYVPTSCGNYTVEIISCCGCVVLSGPYPFSCTGINEFSVQEFHVYPNPVQDELVISHPLLGQNAAMEIYNVLGEKIYSKPLNSKQETVNCKQFSPGVYFVIVADNEKRFIGKFVKE